MWLLFWEKNAKGQRQSPINVVPEELLFDPGLDPIYINQNQVCELIVTIGVFYFFYVKLGRASKLYSRWKDGWSTLDTQLLLGLNVQQKRHFIF